MKKWLRIHRYLGAFGAPMLIQEPAKGRIGFLTAAGVALPLLLFLLAHK